MSAGNVSGRQIADSGS